MAKALTTKRIEKIEGEPRPTSRLEIPDGLLTGLYLVRQTSGALSWAVRYRHEGQARKLTLGSYPAVGLGAARDLGAQALRAAAEGRDPAGEKKAAKVAVKHRAAEEIHDARDLFENVAREFIERHAMKKTRPSSWGETARILRSKTPAKPRGGRRVGRNRHRCHCRVEGPQDFRTSQSAM